MAHSETHPPGQTVPLTHFQEAGANSEEAPEEQPPICRELRGVTISPFDFKLLRHQVGLPTARHQNFQHEWRNSNVTITAEGDPIENRGGKMGRVEVSGPAQHVQAVVKELQEAAEGYDLQEAH